MKKMILSGTAATIVTLGLSANVMAVGADVLTVSAEYIPSVGIEFSGTTSDEVLAVTCNLLDTDGAETTINSVAVENNEFSGKFEVPDNEGFSAVKCANYDGGEYVTANIVVEEEVTEEPESQVEEEPSVDTSNSPETGRFTVEEESSANLDNVGMIASIVTIVGIVLAGGIIAIIAKRRKI